MGNFRKSIVVFLPHTPPPLRPSLSQTLVSCLVHCPPSYCLACPNRTYYDDVDNDYYDKDEDNHYDDGGDNDNDGGRVDANHPVHCPSSYCHSTGHTPHICFPMFDKHCPPCLLELFQILVKRVITRGK